MSLNDTDEHYCVLLVCVSEIQKLKKRIDRRLAQRMLTRTEAVVYASLLESFVVDTALTHEQLEQLTRSQADMLRKHKRTVPERRLFMLTVRSRYKWHCRANQVDRIKIILVLNS